MKRPVDIIVVTFNRIRYFKIFVKLLYSSTKYPFHLIVVDNGSIDGTREYILDLEKDGKVWKHVFNEQNLPLAAALTKGFEQAESELFLTVADDMVVSPKLRHDWLEIFVNKMQGDESIGCINFIGSRCRYSSFIKKYG